MVKKFASFLYKLFKTALVIVSLVGVVYAYLFWVGPISLAVVRPFVSPWTRAFHIQTYDPFLRLTKDGHPSIVVHNIDAFNHKLTIQKAELTFNTTQWAWSPLVMDTVYIHAYSTTDNTTLLPPPIPSIAFPFVMRNVHVVTPAPWKLVIPPLTIKGQNNRILAWAQSAKNPVLLAKANVTTPRGSTCVSLEMYRHKQLHGTLFPCSGKVTYQTFRDKTWAATMDAIYTEDPFSLHQWSCTPLHNTQPQWHIHGTLDATKGGAATVKLTYGPIKVNGQWHGQWRRHALHWTTKVMCPSADLSTACLKQFWTKKNSAQQWTLSNIKKGQLRNASLNATGTWAHNRVSLSTMTARFALDHLCVAAMAHLDDICDVTTDLTWTMANNQHRLSFAIDRGQLGPHRVKGAVTIVPATPDPVLNLDLSIHGPVSEMVKRIQKIKSFPLKMATSQHHSTALLSGTIPLCAKEKILKTLTMDLSVTTPLETIYLDHAKPVIMNNATVNVHMADKKVTVKGANHTYGCPVTWSWADEKFMWDARIDLQPLAQWACPVMVSHPVHVHGLYDGTHVMATADLTHHTVSMPWMRWSKNKGQPMHMSVRHHGASNTSTLGAKSDNGYITGHCTRSSSGIITTCTVNGRLDETMVAYRYTPHNKTAHRTHRLFVRMPTCVVPQTWPALVKQFALSKQPAMPGHGTQTDRPPSTASTHTGTPYTIHMDMACDTLHTAHHVLNDVRIQGTATAHEPAHTPWTLTRWTWNEGYCMADHVPNNNKQHTEAIHLFMEPESDTQNTKIWGKSYHFSPLWSMIQIKNLHSQMAHINAVRHADESISGAINVGSYYAKMPLLGRLLSVVSPSLWTQNFHKKGILFSKTTLDFTYHNQMIDIVNLLSHGYSVGIFCQGKIDLFAQTMTLDGVIMPEYMMNTIFQYVPIIGWVLGGQRGILSSQFSFQGPLSNPKLSLDPLSIFKLGFLKNIFS